MKKEFFHLVHFESDIMHGSVEQERLEFSVEELRTIITDMTVIEDECGEWNKAERTAVLRKLHHMLGED